MADTVRDEAALQALFADNTSQDISPQDLRDFLVSVPTLANAANLPLAGGTMTGTITSTIGTITASTPAFSATQTWNDAGMVFQGIFLNVTNTASNSASRLLNLQAGGTTVFYVDRTGHTQFAGVDVVIGPTNYARYLGTRAEVCSQFYWAWSGTVSNATATKDTGLARNAAGVVEINNGTAGTYRDLILRDIYINGATYLARASASLTNSAGANTATLTNSPVTGNPTKWIAIDDNGTTRHIPAW